MKCGNPLHVRVRSKNAVCWGLRGGPSETWSCLLHRELKVTSFKIQNSPIKLAIWSAISRSACNALGQETHKKCSKECVLATQERVRLKSALKTAFLLALCPQKGRQDRNIQPSLPLVSQDITSHHVSRPKAPRPSLFRGVHQCVWNHLESVSCHFCGQGFWSSVE